MNSGNRDFILHQRIFTRITKILVKTNQFFLYHLLKIYTDKCILLKAQCSHLVQNDIPENQQQITCTLLWHRMQHSNN